MKKYKLIVPSWAAVLSFFILPFIFTIYFVVTRYSDKFLSTTQIDYIAVQNNFLATIFLQQAWNNWLSRIMDFAFWGVLASIGILIWWAVSTAKTSVQNHGIEQSYSNFGIDQKTWHRNFILVASIKTILVFLMIYSVFALIARAIPQLAYGVAACVQQVNSNHIILAIQGVLLMVFWHFLFVLAFKTFKITKAD